MIFGAFERLMAGRYLRARRQEGFVSIIAGFSILGILLGVGTLIVVISVMSGFRRDFVGQVLGFDAHLEVSTYGPLQDFDALAAKLRTIPHVTAVTPLVKGQTLLTLNGYATGLEIRGMRPADFVGRPIFASKIVAGKAEDFNGDQVAVGARLAENLRLNLGDSITLLSPKLASTPFGNVPRKGTFQIGAIFNVGVYQADDSLVLMPLEAAQGFFQTDGGVTMLDIFVQDPEADTDEVHRAIDQMVGQQFRVIDWRQKNFFYLTALDTERITMFIILTLIILVAAFNIISSLIMLVKDKNADIAILRTMGATRGMVLRIFFMTGAAIGSTGALLGVVGGVLFLKNIQAIRHLVESITGTSVFAPQLYIFDKLPNTVEWGQVGLIVAIALALTFLASIIPAWRASRVDPVEALRYE
jgi:lipoprotein-releasing system permease protein